MCEITTLEEYRNFFKKYSELLFSFVIENGEVVNLEFEEPEDLYAPLGVYRKDMTEAAIIKKCPKDGRYFGEALLAYTGHNGDNEEWEFVDVCLELVIECSFPEEEYEEPLI